MINIAFVPVQPYLSKGLLFNTEKTYRGWHLQPYNYLREQGAKIGLNFNTIDLISSPDIIFHQDLPANKSDFLNVRNKFPHSKHILMLKETPMGRLWMRNSENHNLFDLILTYNPKECISDKYILYHLPVNDPPSYQFDNLEFDNRKFCCLVNSNRLVGFGNMLMNRQNGFSGLPLIGPFFNGWKIKMVDVIKSGNGDLYKERRKIARYSNNNRSTFPLDIYGYGWSGETISWLNKIIPNRHYSGVIKSNEEKHLILNNYKFSISLENFKGAYGYVSEKIFDCFYSQNVPVFSGDRSFKENLPIKSYIPYSNPKQIFETMTKIQKNEWNDYINEGQRFLRSKMAQRHYKENFCHTIIDTIDRLK